MPHRLENVEMRDASHAEHICSEISACCSPISIRGRRYSVTDAFSCAGSTSAASDFHLQSITSLFTPSVETLVMAHSQPQLDVGLTDTHLPSALKPRPPP